MQAASVVVFAFLVGAAVCFPADALVGIRFSPSDRQERDAEEMVGIRDGGDTDSSEFVGVSLPKRDSMSSFDGSRESLWSRVPPQLT
ncbi:hypothetical protein OESDEN_06210 [Oesophagostomum dentatum]|uniref:Uncharacterized protein n=1 Tax=Oesophagostomum dentatum TaxID=61180 RepID=A0A0B1TCM5_OESDE|nr:hypothetical protein OESDEN_06210 [Oesophagostomum dentatum]